MSRQAGLLRQELERDARPASTDTRARSERLDLRARVGEGLACRVVRQPEAPRRLRDALGGDSAGEGRVAVGRGPLRTCRLPRARSERFGRRVDPDALAQWSHHISTRWTTSQRRAERSAEARSVPAAAAACVGAAERGRRMCIRCSRPSHRSFWPLRTSRSSVGWRRGTASASSAGAGGGVRRLIGGRLPLELLVTGRRERLSPRREDPTFHAAYLAHADTHTPDGMTSAAAGVPVSYGRPVGLLPPPAWSGGARSRDSSGRACHLFARAVAAPPAARPRPATARAGWLSIAQSKPMSANP